MQSEFELRRQKIIKDLRHDIKMNPHINFEAIVEKLIVKKILTKDEADDILFQARKSHNKILSSIQILLNESDDCNNTRRDNTSDYFAPLLNDTSQFVKRHGDVLSENYILNFSYTKNLDSGGGFHGVRLFDDEQFLNFTEARLKSKLPKFCGILSPRYYKFSPAHDYKECIMNISKGFPVLVRQVIINVINKNKNQYNDQFEFRLYNKILDFNFDTFSLNFNLLLESIQVPISKLSDIDTRLTNEPSLCKFLNRINKPLINDIIRHHSLEYELYFYCSVVMYYLNKFNIDLKSLDSANILNRVSEYSSGSLRSSKHHKLILNIIRKYYVKRRELSANSINTFALNEASNYLIDFSKVANFNIHNFNRRKQSETIASSLKRKYENNPISFSITHDWLKWLNEYLNIKEKENQARSEFDTWAEMDGHKFEHEMLRFFNKYLGMKGEVTPGSGDHGIDIILEKNIAVQCKNHSSRISPGPIRDFIGACKDRGFSKKIFVSRYGYSEESRRLAKDNGVKLLSITTVIDIIQGRTSKDEALQYLLIEKKDSNTIALTTNGPVTEPISIALGIVRIYVKAEVYKFSDIIEDIYFTKGEELEELFPLIKSAYGMYFSVEATDVEADQMDGNVRGCSYSEMTSIYRQKE